MPEPPVGENRRKRTCQEHLYYLFDDPSSSSKAYWLAVLIVTLILVSISAFVAERSSAEQYVPPEVWSVLETVCTMVFSIEYVVRFYAAPISGKSRLNFVTRILNVFDLLAILPWYLELILKALQVEGGSALGVLRLVRVARVLRLFKLSRYSTWLQLVGEGMARSMRPVMILMSFFLLSALISASLMYYLEKPLDCRVCKMDDGECLTGCTDIPTCFPPDCMEFTSIPLALYWAITTMTTVGYGDYIPSTLPGRIFAVGTMFIGILLLALPVIVVGGNFQEVYNESERRKAEKNEREVKKSPAEKALAEWDMRVRDLTSLIERTELTCQASTYKARVVLAGLRRAVNRSERNDKGAAYRTDLTEAYGGGGGAE